MILQTWSYCPLLWISETLPCLALPRLAGMDSHSPAVVTPRFSMQEIIVGGNLETRGVGGGY